MGGKKSLLDFDGTFQTKVTMDNDKLEHNTINETISANLKQQQKTKIFNHKKKIACSETI